MKTAKILQDGEGQVVLLPEDIWLEGTEVYVEKIGNVVKLIPRSESWDTLFQSLERFSEDFMEERVQPQVREPHFPDEGDA